jgi:hypothetical protein
MGDDPSKLMTVRSLRLEEKIIMQGRSLKAVFLLLFSSALLSSCGTEPEQRIVRTPAAKPGSGDQLPGPTPKPVPPTPIEKDSGEVPAPVPTPTPTPTSTPLPTSKLNWDGVSIIGTETMTLIPME